MRKKKTHAWSDDAHDMDPAPRASPPADDESEPTNVEVIVFSRESAKCR